MIIIILKTSFKLEFLSSGVVIEIIKKELAGYSKGILIFSKLCLVSFQLNICLSHVSTSVHTRVKHRKTVDLSFMPLLLY